MALSQVPNAERFKKASNMLALHWAQIVYAGSPIADPVVSVEAYAKSVQRLQGHRRSAEFPFEPDGEG